MAHGPRHMVGAARAGALCPWGQLPLTALRCLRISVNWFPIWKCSTGLLATQQDLWHLLPRRVDTPLCPHRSLEAH